MLAAWRKSEGKREESCGQATGREPVVRSNSTALSAMASLSLTI